MYVGIECPDFLMSDSVGAIIYFDDCNLNCKYCDYKNVIRMKDLKFVRFDELFNTIKQYLIFFDNIIITGGEPLLFKNEVIKIIDFAKRKGKGIWLYTNLSENIDDIINDIDKIVVDVKGISVDEIMKNCGCNISIAKNIIKNYEKYYDNDKFLFRISDYISNENIKFKNIKKYNIKGL